MICEGIDSHRSSAFNQQVLALACNQHKRPWSMRLQGRSRRLEGKDVGNTRTYVCPALCRERGLCRSGTVRCSLFPRLCKQGQTRHPESVRSADAYGASAGTYLENLELQFAEEGRPFPARCNVTLASSNAVQRAHRLLRSYLPRFPDGSLRSVRLCRT